jgi:signal transduction histidine kinase
MKKMIKYLPLLLIVFSCNRPSGSVPELTRYQFKETKHLVIFVNEAADLFSQKGTAAFDEFSEPGSKWFSGLRYVFIYDDSGNCIFHPVLKDQVGKNLSEIRDINGKPILQFIHAIAFDSKNRHGWVHYLWAEPGEIFPCWKHAYIMAVKGPDGKSYAIGSGTYNIRTEIPFVTDIVDSAANLVRQRGKEAFPLLLDPASIFYFYNTYIFVLARDGQLLVDPAFPTDIGRNVIDFVDLSGHAVIREILERFKKNDVVYIPYSWPVSGQANPVKKMMYLRKVKCENDTVFVGSSLFLEEPVWKKF